jgi:hypothetical protein
MRPRIAIVAAISFAVAAPALAQTDVRAWHEDGQTFVVWTESALPTITYEIYRASSAVADTSQATFVGRVFAGEWEGERLKIRAPFLEWTVPTDDIGGTYTLDSDEGLFVHTPHAPADEYFFVVRHSDSACGPDNTSDLVVQTADETPTCHRQASGPFDGHLAEAWAVFSDGSDDDATALPGFPILASAAKHGAPHVFGVYHPGLAPAAGPDLPVTITMHGGDGNWTQLRPGASAYDNIGLDMSEGLVVALDDAIYGTQTNPAGERIRTTWFGYIRDFDPFTILPLCPPDTSIVVPYTQRRLDWIADWLANRSPYDIDGDRISIIGYSSGSRGAVIASRLYPERFSTVNAFCPQLEPLNPLLGCDGQSLETNVIGPSGSPLRVDECFRPGVRLSAATRDIPLTRIYIGRREDAVPWTVERVQGYVDANDAAWGMHLYWDERDHGTNDWSAEDTRPASPKPDVGQWVAPSRTERGSAEYQTRYRRNESYPGFFDDDQDLVLPDRQPDLGDGDPCVGDPWGTWSGYYDWDQSTLVDDATTWACTVFLTGLSPVAVDNALVAEAAASVTIRRPQAFLPAPGAVLSWELVDLAGVVRQSGTTTAAAADGLVTITGLSIPRDPDRVRLVVTTRPLEALRGNVDTLAPGVGPSDVLYVNGSAGEDGRRIALAASDPVTLTIAESPSRVGLGATCWVGAWLAAPNSDSVRTLPASLGSLALPMKLTGGTPRPRRIANSIPGSAPQLGAENWPGPPTAPAPTTLLAVPAGLGISGVTLVFQGLVRDARAPGTKPFSVTNGVVIEVAP